MRPCVRTCGLNCVIFSYHDIKSACPPGEGGHVWVIGYSRPVGRTGAGQASVAASVLGSAFDALAAATGLIGSANPRFRFTPPLPTPWLVSVTAPAAIA